VPVTVKVMLAADTTVIVELPDPVIDAGLNVTVAPAGSPEALSATTPLNPFWPVTVTVPPATARVKSGGVNEAAAECARLPLVPVTVKFAVPVNPLTVNVADPEPLIDAGLNVAVAPAGKPDAPSATVPLKPFSAVTVTVLPTTARLKSGGVIEAAAECTRLPLVPVTVKLAVPVSPLTVSADDPEPVMVAGVNVGVAPGGRPEALSATVPLKPFNAVTVTVLPATASPKSGRASVPEAEWLRPPLVPVTVKLALVAPAMVRVEAPDPVIEVGVKTADAPPGSPEMPSPTVPLKPFCPVTVTVKAFPPAGATPRVKSGAGGPAGTICNPFRGARR